MSEYTVSLSKDNLQALKKYTVLSCHIFILVMVIRCLLYGFQWVNFVPFLVAALGMLFIRVQVKENVSPRESVRQSSIFIACFNTIWYGIVIFYDALTQPNKPSVVCCLAFVLLTCLFHTRPRDNLIGTLFAYVAVILLKMHYETPDVYLVDARNIFLAMALGIFIGQRNAKTNISRKLYTDMYKTATKTGMLVEDNELNIEIAKFLLENEGFIVVTATNGQDAVERFAASEEGEYDMIFMNIMMPVMNGLDATRAIRAMNREDTE